jgi:hypothetical protein
LQISNDGMQSNEVVRYFVRLIHVR